MQILPSISIPSDGTTIRTLLSSYQPSFVLATSYTGHSVSLKKWKKKVFIKLSEKRSIEYYTL